mgnify:CR=1 FL=1
MSLTCIQKPSYVNGQLIRKHIKINYGVVPAVAGLNKFTNLFINRVDYPGRNASICNPLLPKTKNTNNGNGRYT